MKSPILFTLSTIALLLASCSPTASSPGLTAPEPTQVEQTQPEGSTRTDSQGAVTIEVTALNLDNPADSLQFDVSMNTHSVELDMDLVTLATLTTDTGITVQATLWDGPQGGHHVEGKLSFPASQSGVSLLDGAKRLTLTIKDVDAPERMFTWELPAN